MRKNRSAFIVFMLGFLAFLSYKIIRRAEWVPLNEDLLFGAGSLLLTVGLFLQHRKIVKAVLNGHAQTNETPPAPLRGGARILVFLGVGLMFAGIAFWVTTWP